MTKYCRVIGVTPPPRTPQPPKKRLLTPLSGHFSPYLPNQLLYYVFAFLTWREIRHLRRISEALDEGILGNMSMILMCREKRYYHELMYDNDTEIVAKEDRIIPDVSHGFPRLFLDLCEIGQGGWFKWRVLPPNERFEWDWVKKRCKRFKLSFRTFMSVMSRLSKVHEPVDLECIPDIDRYLVDRECILRCLVHDGLYLEKVAPRYQDDKELVMSAVQDTYEAYNFASEQLKRDVDVIIETMSQWSYVDEDPDIVERLPPNAYKDRSFIKTLVTKADDAWPLECADESLLNDAEFMFEMCTKINGDSFRFIGERLKHDRAFVIRILKFSIATGKMIPLEAPLLGVVGEELRRDMEILAKAVCVCVSELECAPIDLRSNLELIELAYNVHTQGILRKQLFQSVPAFMLTDASWLAELRERLGHEEFKQFFPTAAEREEDSTEEDSGDVEDS